MPVSRYNKRELFINNLEMYKQRLKEKGVEYVTQYDTAEYRLDDSRDSYEFDFVEEIWKDGYKLYKLSQKYYNSVDYWWVIGLFNEKPTDSHYEIGDLLLVPYPLEDFLQFIGVYE